MRSIVRNPRIEEFVNSIFLLQSDPALQKQTGTSALHKMKR